MTHIVFLLQVLTGMAWLVPALTLSPAIYRTWRGTAGPVDMVRGPLFFMAVVQVGFSVRWIIWPPALPAMEPTELSTWAGLYTLSIMAAAGVVIANHHARGMR